jgi:heme-degrading monooxygenase HmoA
VVGLHVTFRIKPDGHDAFREWKRREGELQLSAPGFIKRSMSQDAEDPAVYYYVTYWTDEERRHAFAQTPAFQAAQAESGVVQTVESRVMRAVREVFDERAS